MNPDFDDMGHAEKTRPTVPRLNEWPTADFFTAIRADHQPWQRAAACRGQNPDLFFPERGAPTGEAKHICHDCAVRMECLTYALDRPERSGIWGGLSERERRRIRRQRRQERVAS